MQQTTDMQQKIQRLQKQFLHSSDFTAKEITLGPGEQAILCFYSSLVKKSEVERYVHILRLERKRALHAESNTAKKNTDVQKGEQTEPNQKNNQSKQNESAAPLDGDSVTVTIEPYNNKNLIDYICNGETIILLQQTNEMIRLNSPDFVHRTPEEPGTEHVLRGSHEGLVENFDSNVSLLRKRIKNNKLIVKELTLGKETKNARLLCLCE